MQKALVQMNVQLSNVVSDITGVTGLKIIRAIVEGERRPNIPASHRDGRCKKVGQKSNSHCMATIEMNTSSICGKH